MTTFKSLCVGDVLINIWNDELFIVVEKDDIRVKFYKERNNHPHYTSEFIVNAEAYDHFYSSSLDLFSEVWA